MVYKNGAGGEKMDCKSLVKKAQNGDISAFEELINAHKDNVYKTAYSFVGNHHDASDISQIAFIKAYKNIGKFNFKSEFSTWLYRITVNSCLDEIRKLKRQTGSTFSIDDDENTKDVLPDLNTPEEAYEKEELKRKVRENINKLSDKYKRVIIYRDINGLSYDEIAKIEKCSAGTIKSRISRARDALKELISKDGTFFENYTSKG